MLLRSYVHLGPMPITPSAILSLAAATPPRPRARAGTIQGIEIEAAPPAAACFKKFRRLIARREVVFGNIW
jgi:hypothetical protein